MTGSVLSRFRLAALALLAACAPAAAPSSAPAPAPAPSAAAAGPRLGDSLYIARARADSAKLPYTEADIRFMAHMISHHAQAVDMSRWAPTHGASPEVQRLAARIINAQQDEIRLMQQWLADRNQPVPEAKAVKMRHEMDGMVHEMVMPGMLTDEQMAELDAARGRDFDLLFLRYMIQHHQGAVGMVDELFATPGAGNDTATYKLASDVQVDQTTEIARMQQMLFTRTIEAQAK
jgi:uncharacterized protein (DUF305 family)